MPLSWNEIRVRAVKFSDDWKDAHYEKGESQSFYNAFFNIFGRRRRDVAVYEEKVKKLDNHQGFIDLFWPGYLIVEQKSAGRSLEDAREQATDYFLALSDHEKPRYILLSDFQNFELLDLEENEEYHFKLTELSENIRHFDFIAGYQQQKYQDQDPVNIEASELMSNLHKQLDESGYKGHDLEQLLVRIMFCLFADDTGIFQPDSFLRYIEDQTSEDGGNLGRGLIELFQVLDTHQNHRQKTLDEDLDAFPYVNGELFKENIRIPSFNSRMRKALLTCCYFNWSRVSPALFGSLFQTVMLPEEQRQGGAHYTSERNILKVINPLFLDELREEFEKIKSDKSTQKKSRLEKFHEKISNLSFLDPACGCGNFLILAYRELRLLEIELLEEMYPLDERQAVLYINHLSKIDVDHFHGIEIEEFPVRIAETAMWLIDHQMNMKLSESFGQVFVRLPLEKVANIYHGNALSTEWADIIPQEECSYILGNPPFVGKNHMTKEQSGELTKAMNGLSGSRNLDYVSGWYWKAAEFMHETNIICAFVSTNSIVQGEQVSLLWGALLDKFGTRIHFAHGTFKWTIDEKKARGMKVAAVFVIIVGFSAFDTNNKYIYEYETLTTDPHKLKVSNINPYLVEGQNFVVKKRSTPLNNVPNIYFGNMPNDGGYFLFTDKEKIEFISRCPQAKVFFKPFISAHEFLNGKNRWCLWFNDVAPNEYRGVKELNNLIENVKNTRLKSSRQETRNLSNTPYLFGEIRQPENDYILVPRHSSENRRYIPIGFFDKNNIVADSCLAIDAAKPYHFGILTSEMHMAWVRYTCGRLKGDYRYSNTLVYNNFPWPDPTEKQKEIIEEKAKAVLEARKQFPDSTLADLYDPNTMPLQLLKAHQELDKAVDKSYRGKVFKDEKERIEYLFELYQKLTEPLIVKENKKKRKRSKVN